MALPAHSDTLITFVYYSGLVILAITLIMMLFVIFFHIWSIAKNRQIERFNARWLPVLESMGHTIPPFLPPISTFEQFLFLKLWSDSFEKADQVGKANLLELANHLKLESVAVAMLGHESGDYKMLAMRALGHLKGEKAEQQLNEMLKHPNPLFSLLAARALVQIEAGAALNLIMPYFVTKKEWPTNKILLILDNVPAQNVTPSLLDALEYTSLENLPRLIKLFQLMENETARNEAMKLLQTHQDPEVIAGCLHYINRPEDKPLLSEYLSHESWIVRMHAVKAISPLLSAPDIALLFPLLNDRAWWVRFHSARAIAVQPFADEAYLDSLDASLVDPFAKDALRQARSKRSVFEHL